MSGISKIILLNKRGQEITTIAFPIEELSQVDAVDILTWRKERIHVQVLDRPEDGCQVTVHRAHARTLQLHAPLEDKP